MKNWLTRIALALVVTVALTGCSAEQMKAWFDSVGIDHSKMTPEEIDGWAAAATSYWEWQIAEATKPPPAPPEPVFDDKFRHVLSDGQLYTLRKCESGDNYRAVSSSGAYRGAYQFSRSTWNSVAAKHYPEFNGMDPAAAPPHAQDAMTRALWSMMGAKPWPVCGKRV